MPCLICKNHLTNSKSLYKERTLYTRTPMITKLSKIVRKRLDDLVRTVPFSHMMLYSTYVFHILSYVFMSLERELSVLKVEL